jgi:hypothetical protein
MAIKYQLSLFVFIVAAIAGSSTTLCLQGCCGLQLEIPSNHLSFSNPSTKGPQALISLHHADSGIQCCPCDEPTGNSENATAIPNDANVSLTQNATVQASLEQ